MFFRRHIVITLLLLLSVGHGLAQRAFLAGEILHYALYYNWKFVWVRAGSATMSITRTTYDTIPALRTRLLMRGSSEADNYFVLRDTLTSIVQASNLRPLAYNKHDVEGTSYRLRQVTYSYPSPNSCRAFQRYTHKDGRVTQKDETRSTQIHDMLSIMLHARNYNTKDWKPGRRITFQMTDGNGVSTQTLIYRGKEKVKIKGTTASYRCLKLSFVEKDEKGKEEEVVTFFVTDDSNHLPVRLDMYLRFGSAKAFLMGYRGIKNPMQAKLK